MKLAVGNTYKTKKAGPVLIIEDRGAGRKRFIGQLQDGTLVSYFRNGRYSNAAKGGHPFDIEELR